MMIGGTMPEKIALFVVLGLILISSLLNYGMLVYNAGNIVRNQELNENARNIIEELKNNGCLE